MNVKEFKERFQQKKSEANIDQLLATQQVIDQVKAQGDRALYEFTEQFDQQKLSTFKVSPEQMQASWEALDPDLQEALIVAKERIEAYERRIKHEDIIGEEISYVYKPLKAVGVYVPGGTALYPSSVLMTVLPAVVAGVKKIVVTTPVFKATNVTFAALYLCGVTEHVYTIGGAQAIAALAYGTETIPKVDMICGPGNIYVAKAKRLVFGEVGIDSIAGPSEILLYVDETIPVDAVVYDICAQAEHDGNARTFLLTESQALSDSIEARIKELLNEQERREIIQASLANNHYAIVDQRENLLEVINYIGAEHVSIQHTDQDAIVEEINYAGAIFKGYYSMEAIGDYVAGPSHVLPTNQNARFSHGLNVNDFRTSHAVIAIEKETFDNIAPAAERIAQSEALYCHKQSISVRRGE